MDSAVSSLRGSHVTCCGHVVHMAMAEQLDDLDRSMLHMCRHLKSELEIATASVGLHEAKTMVTLHRLMDQVLDEHSGTNCRLHSLSSAILYFAECSRRAVQLSSWVVLPCTSFWVLHPLHYPTCEMKGTYKADWTLLMHSASTECTTALATTLLRVSGEPAHNRCVSARHGENPWLICPVSNATRCRLRIACCAPGNCDVDVVLTFARYAVDGHFPISQSLQRNDTSID